MKEYYRTDIDALIRAKKEPLLNMSLKYDTCRCVVRFMTSLGFYTPALSSFYSIAIFLSLDSLFPGKKTNPEINKSPNSPAKKKNGKGKLPI